MSASHLRALEEALGRRGWRVVAIHPGDDYRVSATWELQRGHGGSLFLDFDGLGPDGDVCLPLAESYGCHVRGRSADGLYFRRPVRSRKLWERELADFVRALDDVNAAGPGQPTA